MHDVTLGRLTKTNVRKKWPNEAGNFTPWLATNLDQLSCLLGIDLQFVAREKSAGPYRADILARRSWGNGLVIIENQLEKADLRHLGQLVAYAASLKAQDGVWIATKFNGALRSAIGMLNSQWPESAGFFSVKLSLFESEDGHFQPILDVVKHPKWWRDPLAVKFWTYFDARRPKGSDTTIDGSSSKRRRRFFVEGADLIVTQFFRADCVRVYITGNKGELDCNVFERIKPYRSSLLEELDGSELLAGRNPRFTTEFQVNSHSEENWDKMVDWLDSQRITYERVLRSTLVARN